MPLYDRIAKLDRCTSTGRKWFIGYAFTNNGEQVSTVIDAFSKEDALAQFHGNFWRITFGDLFSKGPNGVDPRKVYEIIEVRLATGRDRRPNTTDFGVVQIRVTSRTRDSFVIKDVLISGVTRKWHFLNHAFCGQVCP